MTEQYKAIFKYTDDDGDWIAVRSDGSFGGSDGYTDDLSALSITSDPGVEVCEGIHIFAYVGHDDPEALVNEIKAVVASCIAKTRVEPKPGTGSNILFETGIREPRHIQCIEAVDIYMCVKTEAGSNNANAEEVFAVMVSEDAGLLTPRVERWVDGQTVDEESRDVRIYRAFLINERNPISGLEGSSVTLRGRDVTRLVMASADFDRKNDAIEGALAKLTSEERTALGYP